MRPPQANRGVDEVCVKLFEPGVYSDYTHYQSNESGRFEIYVQRFPGPARKLRISTGGGVQARWRRDGTELFYLSLDAQLIAVPLHASSDGKTVEASASVPLFVANPAGIESGDGQQYIVSPDGQRFLVNSLTGEQSATPISVILNWKPKK